MGEGVIERQRQTERQERDGDGEKCMQRNTKRRRPEHRLETDIRARRRTDKEETGETEKRKHRKESEGDKEKQERKDRRKVGEGNNG